MHPPLILLPPSEGKAPGGAGDPWRAGTNSFGELDDARARAIKALGTAMRGTIATRSKLLGVKGAALAQATATNLALPTSPTMPAIERYTGVLYDALDAASLNRRDRGRLSEQVLVFSGLWGIVSPTDMIPDYKLKMGASLARTGRLASFWKPRIDAALEPLTGQRTVWNLLPGEHDAAWSGAPRATAVISVRFLDDVERSGRRQVITVSHWNKLLKGALVRHVLAHQLTDPDGLAAFDHREGYRYQPSLTTVDANRVSVSMVSRR